MHLVSKWRLFQKAATGILCVFMGLMLFVAGVALFRPSGSTRQDMATAHLVRQEALKKKAEAPDSLIFTKE